MLVVQGIAGENRRGKITGENRRGKSPGRIAGDNRRGKIAGENNRGKSPGKIAGENRRGSSWRTGLSLVWFAGARGECVAGMRLDNCGGCRYKVLGGWYSKKSDVKTFPGFGAFAGGADEGSVVVRG